MKTKEKEKSYTFNVQISDQYCTYQYEFKHDKEISIYEIAELIAGKLDCELQEGKFLDEKR